MIGICFDSPPNITNSDGPKGSGVLEGDTRTYDCGGKFLWTDKTNETKYIECQSDGVWTEISLICKSVLPQLSYKLFYFIISYTM